ncbi:MAG: DUF3097 family protein [Corynebacterium sp.]|nr:DUF3097 family protein [Corynebacterium sp.]
MNEYPVIPAKPGLVIEVLATGYCGAVVGFEKTYDGEVVYLEDYYGKRRPFKLRPGAFLYEGTRCTLSRWVQPREDGPRRSASGSIRVNDRVAKVAAPSRIWVEGVHDAAIVEKIWGHDLRVEGVVVEYLEGLDNLPDRLAEFEPTNERRIGVLADHLIEGTKETRLTKDVGPYVLVTGHPYIDIWEAVKPSAVGIPAWPKIPRGKDWKTEVCKQLGWSDSTEGFHRVLGSIKSFRDVDRHLVGAVESLVDFVTNPELSKEDCVL